jgi:hypothetical protein
MDDLFARERTARAGSAKGRRSAMSYEIGSQWRRWDLHFHTPASYEYGDKSLTAANIVDGGSVNSCVN